MIKTYNRQEVQDEYVNNGSNTWVKVEDLPHGFFPRPDDIPALKNHAPDVMGRAIMERAVVRTLCQEMLDQGFELRLNDGEEWSTPWVGNKDYIMQELMATDEERLYVKRAASTEKGTPEVKGSIILVYGNAGWEVISDYSSVLQPFMITTEKFTDDLEKGLPWASIY